MKKDGFEGSVREDDQVTLSLTYRELNLLRELITSTLIAQEDLHFAAAYAMAKEVEDPWDISHLHGLDGLATCFLPEFKGMQKRFERLVWVRRDH